MKLTVLKVDRKEGVAAKTNKPYAFDVAAVVDEDANVFKCNLSDALSKKIAPKRDSIRNLQVMADVEVRPKGFDAALSIEDWKE